jgi:copper chaperone
MIEFDVQDMSCGHCVSAVTKALKAVDPQAKVEVDLPAHKVRVESSEDRQALAEALAEAGYPPA